MKQVNNKGVLILTNIQQHKKTWITRWNKSITRGFYYTTYQFFVFLFFLKKNKLRFNPHQARLFDSSTPKVSFGRHSVGLQASKARHASKDQIFDPKTSKAISGAIAVPNHREVLRWFIWMFPKIVVPNNQGFPTKNDHCGIFFGYHHLRKHPYSWNLTQMVTGEDVRMRLFFWNGNFFGRWKISCVCMQHMIHGMEVLPLWFTCSVFSLAFFVSQGT